MHRIWAMIERATCAAFAATPLVIVSMIMPLVQLVILGNAFGGKIKNLEIGVVDQDHQVQAIKLKEMFQAVAANAATFDTIPYADMGVALHDLRDGKINAVINIPPEFSHKVLAGANPRLSRPDRRPFRSISSSDGGNAQRHAPAFNPPSATPGLPATVSLAIFEVYPYVPYIQFLLPGSITLASFGSCMIGGGIIFIADTAHDFKGIL